MKKLNPTEFRERFYNVADNDYELLSVYVNKRTKIQVKHISCGHIFEILPNFFVVNGQRCPKCRYLKSAESKKKTSFEKVMNQLNNICNKEGYKIVGRYNGYRELIELEHLECNNIFEVKPVNFISVGTRCPKCARNSLYEKRRKSPEQYRNEFNNVANNEYELLSDYKNKRTKVRIKHLICGYEYESLPTSFTLDKCGCPQCNESKGEREVRRFLDKYNLKYKAQFKFNDCRNKNPLPFDYAVFNDDGSIKCLIEYQGIQHYKKTGYFKGVEKLEYTKQNDNIKKIYCNENNIKLIVISYKKFDEIEKIIKEIC